MRNLLLATALLAATAARTLPAQTPAQPPFARARRRACLREHHTNPARSSSMWGARSSTDLRSKVVVPLGGES